MRRIVLLCTSVIAVCGGVAASIAAGAGETTGTNVSCATASLPSRTIAVDGSGVYTIPSTSTSSCVTATYTVPTSTTTTTLTTTPMSSSSTTPTSSTIPTTTTSTTTSTTPSAAPVHVATWDRNHCSAATASICRRWVTFAQAFGYSTGSTSAVDAACHANGTTYCYEMPYFDTFLDYTGSAPGNLLTSATEAWHLHCSAPNQGSRITTSAFGGGFAMNQSNPDLQRWWRSYASTQAPGADWAFFDDIPAGMPFFSLSCNTSAEVDAYAAAHGIGTTQAIQEFGHAIAASVTKPDGTELPKIANSVPDCGNPFEASGQGLGLIGGSIRGLLAEGCPWSNGSKLGPRYPSLLDDAAAIDYETNGFLALLPYDNSGAADNAAARRVSIATVLLTWYSGNPFDGVVLWEDLNQDTNDVQVYPEEGIVPSGPLETMGAPSGTGCAFSSGTGGYCSTGGHNDVEPAPNVFVREFSSCSNQGVPFGRCAAVVNNTGTTITVGASWLRQAYGHYLTFNGGDVQSGGTVSLAGGSFTAGSTSVPANDALVLTP